MKSKFFIATAGIFLASLGVNAQNSDCDTSLSMFATSAKVKDYKSAEPFYEELIEKCPSHSLVIYQYGEKMLKGLSEKAEGTQKKNYINKLIQNYNKRLEYFPNKTPKGDTYSSIAQAMYDNNIGTTQEQYAMFDKAWKTDSKSFNDPKSLYTYFNLLINLQDKGEKSLQDVFTKYDELIKKIEEQEIFRAEEAQPLIAKQEAGEHLSSKENRILKNTSIYLTNFSKIKDGINGLLGQRADCDNLIPLYKKEFESKKDNLEWIKSATTRLSAKECDDPIFFQLVEAQQKLEPSADTAYYLGSLADKEGKTDKAMEYYKQSIELETEPIKKAKVYFKMADMYKKKGSYSNARSYYQKALAAKPSLGIAYLRIASMYADSANNCGDNTFNKRAVYWLAADYADKAARVSPALKSNAIQAAASYRGRAPQKSDIFTQGIKAGETISIGCWIGETIKVPAL